MCQGIGIYLAVTIYKSGFFEQSRYRPGHNEAIVIVHIFILLYPVTVRRFVKVTADNHFIPCCQVFLSLSDKQTDSIVTLGSNVYFQYLFYDAGNGISFQVEPS